MYKLNSTPFSRKSCKQCLTRYHKIKQCQLLITCSFLTLPLFDSPRWSNYTALITSSQIRLLLDGIAYSILGMAHSRHLKHLLEFIVGINCCINLRNLDGFPWWLIVLTIAALIFPSLLGISSSIFASGQKFRAFESDLIGAVQHRLRQSYSSSRIVLFAIESSRRLSR